MVLTPTEIVMTPAATNTGRKEKNLQSILLANENHKIKLEAKLNHIMERIVKNEEKHDKLIGDAITVRREIERLVEDNRRILQQALSSSV